MKKNLLALFALMLFVMPISYAMDPAEAAKDLERRVTAIKLEQEEERKRLVAAQPDPHLMTPAHVYYLLQYELWPLLGVDPEVMALTADEETVRAKIQSETDIYNNLSALVETAVVETLIAFRDLKVVGTCTKDAFQLEETKFVGVMGAGIVQAMQSRDLEVKKVGEISRKLVEIYNWYKGEYTTADSDADCRTTAGDITTPGEKSEIVSGSFDLLESLWSLEGWQDKFASVERGQPLPNDFKKLVAVPELAEAFEGNFLVSQFQKLQLDHMSREGAMRRWKVVTYGRKLACSWAVKAESEAKTYAQELGTDLVNVHPHHGLESNVWADAAAHVSAMCKVAHPTSGDPDFNALVKMLEEGPTQPGKLSLSAKAVKAEFEAAGPTLFNNFGPTDNPAAPIPTANHPTTQNFFRKVQRKLGGQLKPVPQVAAHLQGSIDLVNAEAVLKDQRATEKAQFHGLVKVVCMSVLGLEGAHPLDVIKGQDSRLVSILQGLDGDTKEMMGSINADTMPSQKFIDKLLQIYGGDMDSQILNGVRNVKANDLKPEYLKVLIPQLHAFATQTKGLHTVYEALVELRRYYDQKRAYTVSSLEFTMPVVDLDLDGNPANLDVFIKGLLLSNMEDYLNVQLRYLEHWCSPQGLADMMAMPAPLSVWNIQEDVTAAFGE